MTEQINDSTFTNEVFNSELPVLVDFWAPRCGPCRMLTPILDKLSVELKDKIKIVKLNVDESQSVASAYDINSIPTLLIFNKGKIIGNTRGFQPEPKLREFINSALSVVDKSSSI